MGACCLPWQWICRVSSDLLQNSHSRRAKMAARRSSAMKEVGLVEVALRTAAKVAAVGGVLAVVIWLSWVMLDVEHMNGGFTLP
tara:strand:+ start:15924 stop:16175 length:252 start_codon:yes stop_codon:yes gene_type:complete